MYNTNVPTQPQPGKPDPDAVFLNEVLRYRRSGMDVPPLMQRRLKDLARRCPVKR